MQLLQGGRVSIEQIVAVALRRESVRIATQSRTRVGGSRQAAVAYGRARPVYGRSTGVGSNRTIAVHDEDGQLERLLRSHATSLGAVRDPKRVRATCAVRVAQLLCDGNGISPAALDGLVDGLNDDCLPAVREGGGLGTGDLTPLATIGVWLLDAPGGRRIEPGDGLVLMSSNAATLADALLALVELERLAGLAIRVGANCLVGANGNLEAFSRAACEASPFDGVQRVCEVVNSVVPEIDPARIQDSFPLRCMPQVLGAALDALAQLRSVVERMLNAPGENPVVSARLGVAHHGGFHAIHLAQSCELVASAVASAAAQSLGRLTLLADPVVTGCEPYLSDGTAGASGTMVVEYAAASRLAHLRALVSPVSFHSVNLSRGVEDDASFASAAAEHLLTMTSLWREMLACELLVAVRCLRQQGRAAVTFERVSGVLGSDEDRDLTAELDSIDQLLAEDAI